MKDKKYYVVWQGHQPGIYDNWDDCLKQTKGVKGAKYKSFKTKEEAEIAFESNPEDYIKKKANKNEPKELIPHAYPKEVDQNTIAVDAACSGNPGMMEYQGVHVASGQKLFHFGPTYGTNNIGEFLSIVHCLAYQEQHRMNLDIYSDSKIAMGWVARGKCNTKLPRNAKTEKLHSLISRAEEWLATHKYTVKIIKWKTEVWGEIPADFGRKK